MSEESLGVPKLYSIRYQQNVCQSMLVLIEGCEMNGVTDISILKRVVESIMEQNHHVQATELNKLLEN
ncbi:hypothetical protein [Chroococcidiopsis sp. CCMEE 29]|uniref:hypothetical protein n=1 Tax=Chroococcidiopsis sp. CCMEE 29 TaxID=155894 RepID=UPI002022503F|nr:hypothetical protein [Chroococcidiopsis sp. CCMEE 29]